MAGIALGDLADHQHLPLVLAGFHIGGEIAHDGGYGHPAPRGIGQPPFELVAQMVERRQRLESHAIGIGIEAIIQRKAQIAFLHPQRKALIARAGPTGAEIVGLEHKTLIEVEIGIGAGKA